MAELNFWDESMPVLDPEQKRIVNFLKLKGYFKRCHVCNGEKKRLNTTSIGFMAETTGQMWRQRFFQITCGNCANTQFVDVNMSELLSDSVRPPEPDWEAKKPV